MKKTNFISGMLVALWFMLMIVLAYAGIISNLFTEKVIYDNCSGESVNLLDEYSADYSSYSFTDRISSSPMRNYFFNLDSYGYNQKGSCGYIALGMLLTYYDSYWDDNVVPEKYDKNAYLDNYMTYSYSSSPGSNEVSIENADNISDEQYINTLVNNYSNYSLHAKLVSIGKNLGYGLNTTPTIVYNVLTNFLDHNDRISINDWVINKYSNDNYKTKVPGQEITYSDMMFNSIKDYLKLEIPVLVSIRGEENIGHVVIAYDYDDDNNIIYANFGWRNSYNKLHSNIFSYGYEYIRGYIALGPLLPHSHSNNYIVNGVAVCSCALPNHKHEYAYKSNNSTTHAVNCYCGYSSTKNHNFKSGLGVESKYLICQDCKYMKLNSGTITPVKPGL